MNVCSNYIDFSKIQIFTRKKCNMPWRGRLDEMDATDLEEGEKVRRWWMGEPLHPTPLQAFCKTLLLSLG